MKRHVSNGLSEALLEGFVDDGDQVRIELASDESGLTFERILSGADDAADAAEAGGDGAATVDA
jgi:ATP-dependent Clp protease ATP-binding subunit ClpB